jgi:hypothetical protein
MFVSFGMVRASLRIFAKTVVFRLGSEENAARPNAGR